MYLWGVDMNANQIAKSIADHLIELDDENEISSESMVKAVTMLAAKTMQQFDVKEVEGGGVKLILTELK
tara:strand:+ start:41822 stop:42028 length:207 start_codon:yes stop_codon:yes gene_type:complete